MNENLVRLLEDYTDRYPHALERRFNRILEKVVELWGTPALDAYFDELLVVKRGMVREGFPPEVASDIFSLSLAYAKWHEAKDAARSGAKPVDVWQNIPRDKRHEFESLGVEFSPKGFERAVEANNEEAVALFLSCGVDVDLRDERGWTPLTISAFDGHEHLAGTLIRHGAKVRLHDKHGYTAMHWAAFRGHDKVVDLLAGQGADVNAASHSGWTPLMQAATRGHVVVVAKLLARGARINVTTNDGWSALHKAAANGHGAVVSLLLAKGADPSIRHPNGSTAFTLALRYKHNDIASMLSSFTRRAREAATPAVTVPGYAFEVPGPAMRATVASSRPSVG